jgi:hypothetical protein
MPRSAPALVKLPSRAALWKTGKAFRIETRERLEII